MRARRLSQEEEERSRASQGSFSSSQSTIIYDPRENDRQRSQEDRWASPTTQARHDTPPSTQQYVNWSHDQRRTYRQEVANNASVTSRAEANQSREESTYFRNRYNNLLEQSSREPEPLSSRVYNWDRDAFQNYHRVGIVRTSGSQETRQSSQMSYGPQLNRLFRQSNDTEPSRRSASSQESSQGWRTGQERRNWSSQETDSTETDSQRGNRRSP